MKIKYSLAIIFALLTTTPSISAMENISPNLQSIEQSTRMQQDVEADPAIVSTIEYLVIKQEYDAASALCQKSNIDFLPFLCKQLADLTFSLEPFYDVYFICTRLKGDYARALFIVKDIAGNRFVTAQGGKACIWDMSRDQSIPSLPTANQPISPAPTTDKLIPPVPTTNKPISYYSQTTTYCCFVENREEVIQLIELIKEFWPYNDMERYLQKEFSTDQGYIPADFRFNFSCFLQYHNYIKRRTSSK